jgi:hypothetical protein
VYDLYSLTFPLLEDDYLLTGYGTQYSSMLKGQQSPLDSSSLIARQRCRPFIPVSLKDRGFIVIALNYEALGLLAISLARPRDMTHGE